MKKIQNIIFLIIELFPSLILDISIKQVSIGLVPAISKIRQNMTNNKEIPAKNIRGISI